MVNDSLQRALARKVVLAKRVYTVGRTAASMARFVWVFCGFVFLGGGEVARVEVRYDGRRKDWGHNVIHKEPIKS